jgi:hypothetical protein
VLRELRANFFPIDIGETHQESDIRHVLKRPGGIVFIATIFLEEASKP